MRCGTCWQKRILLILLAVMGNSFAVSYEFTGILRQWDLGTDPGHTIYSGFGIQSGDRFHGTFYYNQPEYDILESNPDLGKFYGVAVEDAPFLTMDIQGKAFIFPSGGVVAADISNTSTDTIRFGYGILGSLGGGNVQTPWEEDGESINTSADHFNLIFFDETGTALGSDRLPDSLTVKDWTTISLTLNASVGFQHLSLFGEITHIQRVPEAGQTAVYFLIALVSIQAFALLQNTPERSPQCPVGERPPR
jgi:hypothetical protein